ncbi:LytTR family transcriptional regulator [Xylanibacillus composti]|uniref:HTH LytTR-type domain-containing protein n=1 Tax=Xylanibacillus composti TaxID=1572762 RepID=A0A8J4M0Z7_9BACL|nr:LytTR family transcriptional regulator [Xylanibacillus composti]GIQ67327.1 hypothetical protein XYCOK13_01510 [Xylanibacillus composti]
MQVPVQRQGKIEWVHLKDIIHIQSAGSGKLLFHTAEKSVFPLRTFSEWSELFLSDELFVQVDRGNLINLNHVIGYDDCYDLVKLRHSEQPYKVPVAQSQIMKLRRNPHLLLTSENTT